MQNQYYINIDGKMDGPHDLITIMRRIRAGKINANTQIFSDGAAAPLPASFIPEIAGFFDQKERPAATKEATSGGSSISTLLAAGWQFTMEKNIVTVYAGALLLISIMLVVGMVNSLGALAGGLVSWCILVILHHLYLIYILRLYRGQNTGTNFIKQHLAPVMFSIISVCILFALLTSIGCLVAVGMASLFSIMREDVILQTLLVTISILPGTFIAALFILAPLIILDQRCSPLKALRKSELLLVKPGHTHYGSIVSLMLLHVLCLLLIIPIPLTLPIFAAALAEFYEGMVTS